MRRFAFHLLAMPFVLTFVEAQAQRTGPNAPDSLSVQGLLTETDGDPVADGFYELVFKLYKDGTNIWEQTHDNVPVIGGVFNVILGGTVDASLDTVAFNVPIELGITVEDNPEIVPRTPLTSAAYAMAIRGMYAVDAEQFNGESGNDIAPNLIGGAPNNHTLSVVGATIGGGGGVTGSDVEAPNSVTGSWGTVSGGLGNSAAARGSVGGGSSNTAGHTASIGGGNGNVASIGATVSGGAQNHATGSFSSVWGGSENDARGTYSAAAGRFAKANHEYSFVWNSTFDPGDSLSTTGANQFIIGAPGGVGINTGEPTTRLHVENNNLGLGPANMENDVVVIEGSDPVLGLYGSPGGNWSAGVTLSELTTTMGIGILVNKWAMARNTSGAGNYLRFTFGTDSDYSVNDTQMRIEPGGDVRADGSFIGGGADVAEAVDPVGRKKDYEPGDVLVVATSADRTFERSHLPYATTVAGIYAAKPGVLLHNTGMDGDLSNKIPLAVLGIVPTKVIAENGPIQRGDLLVTSSTEGHAMKAAPVNVAGVDIYPTGAVLGKALEPFDGPGSGMIEVLVNVK